MLKNSVIAVRTWDTCIKVKLAGFSMFFIIGYYFIKFQIKWSFKSKVKIVNDAVFKLYEMCYTIAARG